MQMTGTDPGLSHPARECAPKLAHDNSGTGERDSGSNKSTVLSYDISDKRMVSPPASPAEGPWSLKAL